MSHITIQSLKMENLMHVGGIQKNNIIKAIRFAFYQCVNDLLYLNARPGLTWGLSSQKVFSPQGSNQVTGEHYAEVSFYTFCIILPHLEKSVNSRLMGCPLQRAGSFIMSSKITTQIEMCFYMIYPATRSLQYVNGTFYVLFCWYILISIPVVLTNPRLTSSVSIKKALSYHITTGILAGIYQTTIETE